jgi:hypothetical protein
MSTAFETRKRYDADRVALMDAELARIAATEGLSRDLTEMIGRMRSIAPRPSESAGGSRIPDRRSRRRRRP